MQKMVLALMATCTVLAPSIAMAQASREPTNRMPSLPGRMTEQQHLSRFENEEQRRRLAATPEEAEAQYGAARLDLARQIAALVEQRKCDEARAMANAAGERQMALRIRRTCR